ncbi:MAG: methyltransferase domain-containing protein [Cytophagales bacterium]|nr:methyltransferase domain-containing protein [Cytophagales bacterium]
MDIRSFDRISFTYDCRKKLPFRNATVARIRCEHVFEHLDKRDEVPAFLSECLRALKPGGTLRIVVPDLEKFIKAYVSQNPKEWALLGWNVEHLPANFHTPMDILNHTFRQDGEHKYGYDSHTLQITLQKAGFRTVQLQSWGNSSDALLTDDLENHKNYSIYMDAIK